jgi:hypothetical protein
MTVAKADAYFTVVQTQAIEYIDDFFRVRRVVHYDKSLALGPTTNPVLDDTETTFPDWEKSLRHACSVVESDRFLTSNLEFIFPCRGSCDGFSS